MNNISNCIICGKPLSGKQRSFCCTDCKNQYFLSYKAQKGRAEKKKAELIAIHEGKCGRCGYSFSLSALSFYDKYGESLHVDTNVLANSSPEKLEDELKNAQVLCRNCYEELQNPASKILKQVQADVNIDVLTKKFEKNLISCGVKAGQTIVLGVSGGVDSVTMLDLFSKSKLNLKIIIAHMNHGLRTESSEDELLVNNLATKHGFPFYSKRLEPHKEHSHILENMRMSSSNQEEYFRDERRSYLLSVAENNDADYLALAHNANDQAETLIMNLVRGSGPAGLGAMNMKDGKIIRPLLDISRSEIESYAAYEKLEWHEDQTNRDTNYSRNYIRHRLLPMLSRLNPEFLSIFGRTATLQGDIDNHFKAEAYRIMREPSSEKLRHLDKPLFYEVFGLMYETAKGDRKNLSLSHLSAIHQMIMNSNGTKSLDLPGGITVRRAYDKLDFYVKKEHNVPSAPSTKKLSLGMQNFGKWAVDVNKLTSIEKESPLSLVIDEKTFENLYIRTKCSGDVIAKKGLGANKKLQDLFVDAKIDRVDRAGYPLFVQETDHEIIWVPGLAKSEYKPKKETNLYKISLEEVENETTKE